MAGALILKLKQFYFCSFSFQAKRQILPHPKFAFLRDSQALRVRGDASRRLWSFFSLLKGETADELLL